MQPKVKVCYIDKGSFVYEIKTEHSYKDVEEDTQKKFDTSRCSKDDKRLLTIEKNTMVISMMKNELGGKIMTEFVALKVKI